MFDAVEIPVLPDEFRADDLPSLPTVALEIVRLSRDERATLDDLARTLSQDPALAAQLLKLANSALYAAESEITTLPRACMVVGLRTVRIMALGFSLTGTLREGGAGAFPYAEFWQRSVVCAAAARVLGRACFSGRAEEAFLAGLLSRIGQLVMARALGVRYSELVEQCRPAWPDARSEREAFGFDGSGVGAALLVTWNIPAEIWKPIRALGAPAEPEKPSKSNEVGLLLRGAALIEEMLCGPEKGAAREDLDRWTRACFGWSTARVDEVLVPLGESVAEMAELFDVDAAEIDVASLLADARRQMMEVGLRAAADVQIAEQREGRLALQNEALKRQSQLDPLTGLTNREGFDRLLDECVARRRRGASADDLGLLMIDVDHFKQVNDRHGHVVGDSVLKMLGRVLPSVSRDSDVCARYGGEEFAIVMPRTTARGLEALAERVRAAIEAERVPVPDGFLKVTVSLGGACISRFGSADDAKRLVELADRCLYEAKESGRNRSVIHPGSELPPARR